MADKKNAMSEKPAKKDWHDLKLKQLDVPSATQTGMGRLDPGEGFVFYRNS